MPQESYNRAFFPPHTILKKQNNLLYGTVWDRQQETRRVASPFSDGN